MSTHKALATVAIRAPLGIIEVPTVKPQGREVRVRVLWTASSPLDLHQNDGGLFVQHPQILGDGVAGEVEELGSDVKNLAVGDKVFGFCFENAQSKPQQEYVTVKETSLGKLPPGFTLREAVTLPNNVVTSFHALTHDLNLSLPFPIPPNFTPAHANSPILIWGGSSSVGQYALQILSHWGYKNLLATASPIQHSYLLSLGAAKVFDYRSPDVVEKILDAYSSTSTSTLDAPQIPFIFDCIGSKFGSLAPIAKIAKRGAKVAVLLPVVVRDASETQAPEYGMEVRDHAEWAEGVDVSGVRTHFYAENEFFREELQPTILPFVLAEGIVKPNRQRVVEGATLLERGQKALDILRRKEVSAERLVWRVSEA